MMKMQNQFYFAKTVGSSFRIHFHILDNLLPFDTPKILWSCRHLPGCKNSCFRSEYCQSQNCSYWDQSEFPKVSQLFQKHRRLTAVLQRDFTDQCKSVRSHFDSKRCSHGQKSKICYSRCCCCDLNFQTYCSCSFLLHLFVTFDIHCCCYSFYCLVFSINFCSCCYSCNPLSVLTLHRFFTKVRELLDLPLLEASRDLSK